MKAPTNRQLAILAVLRRGQEQTIKQCCRILESEMPPCHECGGERTDTISGCRTCFGRGRRIVCYGDVYTDLRALLNRGLVARRHPRNEWGDELNTHVYRALAVEQSVDELERIFTDSPAQ